MFLFKLQRKVNHYMCMMKKEILCHPGYMLTYVLACVVVMFMLGVWQDLLATRKSFTPPPVSVNPLYPSRLPLLNLPDFKYIINNNACNGEVYTVVIVHTHPANREIRDTMRRNIPTSDLKDLSVRRVFLMARAEWNDQELYQKTPQWKISDENAEYSDIIQGNFKEHYHNLTYKHIMGLQWVTRYCSQAKFVIKMDDDIVVDLYQFRDKLRYRFSEKRNTILGLMQIEAKPVRAKENKWYVSEDDYPGKYYDNFVSGWAYAMTFDAARAIVKESFKWPYFWIDDVHVTGTLAQKAGVKREALNRFYTIHVEHLFCCLDLPNSSDYYCEFLAGPSEGDVSLLARSLRHARSCYVHPCQRRPPEASVFRTCVRAKEAPLAPQGRGRGEIVRVARSNSELVSPYELQQH